MDNAAQSAEIGRRIMLLSWQILVCCQCVLLICCWPTCAQRRRIGECIRAGDDVDCVSIDCNARITINQANGQQCGPLVENGRSLNGSICDRLVDAIESIAAGHTRPFGHSSCVVVDVYPTESGAPHVISGRSAADATRVISGINVLFRGISIGSNSEDRGKRQSGPRVPRQVTTIPPFIPPTAVQGQPPLVKFEPAMGGMIDDEPRYVLRFNQSQLVAFKNINFTGTFGIVGADLISLIAVEECSFSGFIQGALDIFNCPTVIVRTSVFSGNGFATTVKTEAYRGHAGAISIGYIQTNPPPFVNISNCTFRNNSAELTSSLSISNNTSGEPSPGPSAPSFSSPDQRPSRGMALAKPANELQAVRGGVIATQTFPGRGGGVAIIFNVNLTSAIANVEDCLFVGNSALELGGGLYVLLDGTSNHSVTINRTKFMGNMSPSTAGGLQITFLQEGQRGGVHQILVENSIFTGNQASYGGAVFFLPLTINALALDDGQLGIFAQFKNCLFTENSAVEVGGAFGVAFYILAKSAQFIRPLEFIDCNFTHNTVVGGGVVSTAYFPLSFYGRNRFSFNNGPSLAVVGSRVRLYGSLRFSSNSNTGSLDGGSLYVTSLGQLEIREGAALTFFNNSGTLGASIVVQNPPLIEAYSQLLYNPLCSLIHNNRLPPDLWNVSVRFASNRAVVAAAVYMNNLNLCSWTQLSQPFFNSSNVFRWDFVDLKNDNKNSGHSQANNQSYSIQTPAVRLQIAREQVVAFPGESIHLGVFAKDELNVSTSALFTLSDDSIVTLNGFRDMNGELYRFTPSSLNLVNVGPNTELDVRMRIRSKSPIPIGRREVAVAKMITDNRKFLTITDAFNVSSRFCPPGRRLLGMNLYRECSCDEGAVDIISCDGKRVHIEDHLWGTAVAPEMDAAMDNLLETVSCPGGYCQCTPLNTSGVLKCTHVFDPEDPDAQCHCNRTGALCGGCVSGTGFSALLDHCVSCSDVYSLFVVALVFVDAVIILVLLAVSKPVPLWFYPVVYYLQLLPHFTTHFPITFEEVRPYLVYVSSALGLYFPYDFCLYDEASALASYAFRYIPFLVAVVLSPIAVCFRKRRSPRDSWHGVWWLLLLLYTPVVHTSVSILHCPSFPAQDFNSTDFSTGARWFVNGNIQCFTGAHIALGLFAILALMFSSLLIPLLFFVIFAEEKQLQRRPRLFELAVVAFRQSFKFWWWGPLELLRRLVLVIMSVVFPRNDYPVIFTLALFTGVTSFVKPYGNRESHKRSKKGYAWAVNILDSFLASNVLILLLLRNTRSVEEDYEEFPSFIQEMRVSSSAMTVDQCGIGGLTRFAIMLTPLYYLPLLVALSALLAWLTASAGKRYWNSKKETKGDSERERNVVEMKEARSRTQTVVDFRQYNPDDEVASPAPLASLSPGMPTASLTPSATRTPSLSLTSWIYKLSKRGSSRKKTKEKERQIELKGVEETVSEDKLHNIDVERELVEKDLAIQENDDNKQSTYSSDCSVTEI